MLERWRNLSAPDFIFANDDVIQQLSQRILSNEGVVSSLSPDLQTDFPGMIALLPVTFHVSDQIVLRLKDLLKYKGKNYIISKETEKVFFHSSNNVHACLVKCIALRDWPFTSGTVVRE